MKDLRRHSRQTTIQLVIGFIAILLLVGEGLIWVIYGPGAAGMGLICLGAAGIPILLIFLFFIITEWIVKHERNR